MVKLKWKVSKTLRANSLDGETAEQGHGWGSLSGWWVPVLSRHVVHLAKWGLVMRSRESGNHEDSLGEKKEQEGKKCYHRIHGPWNSKGTTNMPDILWAPSSLETLALRLETAGLWWRAVFSPCGSASSGSGVGNADFWAPCALHRISESWWRAWESAVSSGPPGDSDVLRILFMELDFVGHTCPRDNLQPLMGLLGLEL